ncbi:MAG: exodeoxyribonuclease V subunit alpha [Kineosporiaceae bacterium]|nr:exodeoxyribonuclease V subunit alpha [Kineosporiaceae bacterium]MBK8077834.1 exodeoxyribonuclease V subunit alpha [Kineosporiaceae bacterium]
MTAAWLAVRSSGLLGEFNTAGVLSAADVHVARRLGALTGEGDERVLLAVALAVRGVRAGSVCLFLDDRDAMLVPEAEDRLAGGVDPADASPLSLPDPRVWAAALAASPLLASGAIRLVDGRLYLERYWRDESLVREQVAERLRGPIEQIDDLRLDAAVRRLFPHPDDARQRQAAATAARSRLCVVTGGPGTGKTTTVARLVAVLQAVAGPGLRVALAAPTGKAAARLAEAVRAETARLDPADRERVGELTAGTVHRLLGWRAGSRTRFVHNRHHHLPHDLVVVDETSMVSLPLMARLLEAISPQARLVLVGDPDQLASVEAGAVLGDLVAHPEARRTGVIRLEVVHRHGSVIGELARAVRAGEADAVIELLRAGSREVSFVEPLGDWVGAGEIQPVRVDAEASGLRLRRAARAGDIAGALAALESHQVLLAHRRGPFGVSTWAARVESWLVAAEGSGAGRRHGGPWYPGRPLLVTVNDRDSGLFNGDTGVVVADQGESGVIAAFGDPHRPVLVRPHRLPSVETVHAMTVHRAQGSQFARVSVVLPPATSPLLTRELLYTALTRAREHVRVVGSEAAVRAAVTRPVRRASGLRFG